MAKRRKTRRTVAKSYLDQVGRTKFCPREIAHMWGVGRERILTLIRNGDLPATNVAIDTFGRPRYLVSLEDIKKFELRRAVQPPPPLRPERRRKSGL
jgi:hypothetical protein